MIETLILATVGLFVGIAFVTINNKLKQLDQITIMLRGNPSPSTIHDRFRAAFPNVDSKPPHPEAANLINIENEETK